MNKVLISAFRPFHKSSNNYSSEVLKYISSDTFAIDKLIVDVVYDESYKELSNYDLNHYDLIIALGEARSRHELTIEKQAINLSSCSIPDNKGNLKKQEIINNNQENYLQTKLDLSVLDGFTISNDAGKYVCNNLYFHLLENYPNKSLFIHIPECDNLEENYKKHAENIINIINVLLKNKK